MLMFGVKGGAGVLSCTSLCVGVVEVLVAASYF